MRALTIFLFIVYLVILVKIVLFKGALFYQVVPGTDDYRINSQNKTYYGYNLVPFRTILSFLTLHPSTSTSAKVFNLLGNIALFIPFGFLFPILFDRMSKFKTVFFISLLLSLFFELFQLITHTGQSDVDDLILNSLGAV